MTGFVLVSEGVNGGLQALAGIRPWDSVSFPGIFGVGNCAGTDGILICLPDLSRAVSLHMEETGYDGERGISFCLGNFSGGIDFSVQGEFPRHTDIRSVDLCAILGNLLDNAIEAAGKVKPPEQSFVSLTIRRINQMLVIKVENSFAVSPVQREGVKRAVFVYFIVFFSLRAGEFHLEISPMILYLTVSTFSAGIMWQTLSCRDGQSSMKNLFMLPFDRKPFIFSYVSETYFSLY